MDANGEHFILVTLEFWDKVDTLLPSSGVEIHVLVQQGYRKTTTTTTSHYSSSVIMS